MNRKQQKIANRHITDKAHFDSRQAYEVALVEKVEIKKRIAASRLILNGLLSTDDVFKLNDQLAKVVLQPDRQVEILETWFNWIEAVEKYKVAKAEGHGYATDWFRYDYLLSLAEAAREEVESI